jgi:pyruvate,water dikinase
VPEAEMGSEPMTALWEGILEEGWPARPAATTFPALSSASGDQARRDGPAFSESSYAFLGEEYVILGLRMGYHLSTIEAMSTDEPSKNFIRIQHTDGGAAFDRKVRRVRVIERLLTRVGFACSRQGDFLDARMSYLSRDAARRNLRLLGRITMLTKQLDMALGNDEIAEWYARDFIRKLGLEDERPDR